MNIIQKIHYQLLNPISLIVWCWLGTMFFIGGIWQLESNRFNFWAVILMLSALILMIIMRQRHVLIIDYEHQTLLFSGIILRNSHIFTRKQIQHLRLAPRQAILSFVDASYFPMHLVVSKKGQHLLNKFVTVRDEL